MLSLSPKPREEGSLPKQERSRAAPRILGQTSARHFRLLTLASIPMTATAHPIELLPRQHRRTSGGPPVLHGFPPAPKNHRFSSSLPPSLQYFQWQQMFETDFVRKLFFRTPNQTPSLFLRNLLQADRKST